MLYCRIDPNVPAILTAVSSTHSGSCLVRLASVLISCNIFLRILFSDPMAMVRIFASFSNNFSKTCGRSCRKADTAASFRLCSFAPSLHLFLPAAPTPSPPPSSVAPAPNPDVGSPSAPSSLPRFRFSPTFASAAQSPSSVQWVRMMSCKYRPLMYAVLARRYRSALAESCPELKEHNFLGGASGRGTGTTSPLSAHLPVKQ